MGCTTATHDPIVLLFVQEKADFPYRAQWHKLIAQKTKPGSDHFYPFIHTENRGQTTFIRLEISGLTLILLEVICGWGLRFLVRPLAWS
jgi:hypothetical protein